MNKDLKDSHFHCLIIQTSNSAFTDSEFLLIYYLLNAQPQLLETEKDNKVQKVEKIILNHDGML